MNVSRCKILVASLFLVMGWALVVNLPAAELRFEKERTQFRALLLKNPNYFGNLPEGPIPPVVKIVKDTFFEEIGCVGFQPQLSRLQAVVYVK